MYIRCVFLVAPFCNRWFLNSFSLCSKEQRNICIPSQGSGLPCAPPTAFGVVCGHCRSCGAQPSNSWGLSPHWWQKGQTCTFELLMPAPLSTQAVGEFSKLSQPKINPTKREKEQEGRVAPRPISPWHHRPPSQRSTRVSRGGELLFGWSPGVGQLRPVVKPHSRCGAERAGVFTNKPLCGELHCQCLC